MVYSNTAIVSCSFLPHLSALGRPDCYAFCFTAYSHLEVGRNTMKTDNLYAEGASQKISMSIFWLAIRALIVYFPRAFYGLLTILIKSRDIGFRKYIRTLFYLKRRLRKKIIFHTEAQRHQEK